MRFDYNAMRKETADKIKVWVQENGWPTPGRMFQIILVMLICRHRLSLVSELVDECIDRIEFTREGVDRAMSQGNLMALVFLKGRLDDEEKNLAALSAMLGREGPMRKAHDDTARMIESAREHSFEDLLSSYGCRVRLHRTRCPVHEGKNPSSFEVRNNRGRCHSCGWSGDSIDLVMKMDNCTFMEAVRRLA